MQKVDCGSEFSIDMDIYRYVGQPLSKQLYTSCKAINSVATHESIGHRKQIGFLFNFQQGP